MVKRPDLSKNLAMFLQSEEADNFRDDYNTACTSATRYKFDKSDIVAFINNGLKDFEDVGRFGARAGVYISALVNTHMGKSRVRLDLSYLEKRIDAIGAFLDPESSLTLIGNFGQAVGYNMSGRLVIEGSVGDLLGCDMCGAIVLFGSAGHYVGYKMRDGKITIKNGNIGSIDENRKYGRIYHNDKLFEPRTRRL